MPPRPLHCRLLLHRGRRRQTSRAGRCCRGREDWHVTTASAATAAKSSSAVSTAAVADEEDAPELSTDGDGGVGSVAGESPCGLQPVLLD
ncbi:hypothetical protein C2845_PM05G19720 [Panicum miliaceum]|uniref:Uncharacterized protein n=1 Tax=Panicum miliaceum TaxID=4540 RepID=A0A3L6SUW6_PANMI|nr:hypothetical protein C2845_PM05G19720 [Panicum miliaceum]